MDFTATWHWPQWAFLFILLMRLAWLSSNHGKPMLEIAGEDKGKPRKYNGFTAITTTVIWVSILICGGFFS